MSIRVGDKLNKVYGTSYWIPKFCSTLISVGEWLGIYLNWNLFGLLTQIYLISVLFLLNPICPDAYIEILKRETKDLPDLSEILKLAAENFFKIGLFLIWTLILHLWQYAWPTFFGLIKYHWPFEDLMFNCRRLSHPLWHNITCSVRTPLSGSPTSLSSSLFSFFQLLVLTVHSFPFNRGRKVSPKKIEQPFWVNFLFLIASD